MLRFHAQGHTGGRLHAIRGAPVIYNVSQGRRHNFLYSGMKVHSEHLEVLGKNPTTDIKVDQALYIEKFVFDSFADYTVRVYNSDIDEE